MSDNTFFEYVGNLHIHSSFSDGAGAVSHIARSASKVGLDFIIFNDHDFMTDALHLEAEGFQNDVLILMGLEIGRLSHHYLAYDLNQMVRAGDLDPQKVIDLVNELGGFGFLAHPFEKGMPFHEKSVAYTWNDLSVTGFAGICIWNFSSRWKERVRTVFHGLFYLLFKSRLLKGPSRKTLAFWDRSCRDRRVVAIGGSDAHGTVFKYGPVCFRPLNYDYLLNSINVHILLDKELSKDFSRAKAEVYGAMRQGRLFIVHERLAPGKGFRFHYVSEDGINLTMGDEGRFKPGSIQVEAPLKGEIRLVRNGILHQKRCGRSASFQIEQPGVYRIEVYRPTFLFGWRPWIFSNPIYMGIS